MEKDSFILHNDQFECFSLLSMEQRGLLITAIFEFSQTGTTTQDLPDATHMAYHLITRQLARDSEKYSKICEKRRKYGSLGGKQKQANATKSKHEKASVADTDTDTDTDTGTDTDYIPPIIPPKGKSDDENKPSVMEQRFNQFWSAYPKKVGKAYAEQCFKKLKPTAELTEKMLDAISEQKKSSEWTKDNGQFIPNPSTWLNQGRWQDELTKAKEPKPNVTTPKYGNYDVNEAMQLAMERSYSQATPNPSTSQSDADKLMAEALKRTYGG